MKNRTAEKTPKGRGYNIRVTEHIMLKNENRLMLESDCEAVRDCWSGAVNVTNRVTGKYNRNVLKRTHSTRKSKRTGEMALSENALKSQRGMVA